MFLEFKIVEEKINFMKKFVIINNKFFFDVFFSFINIKLEDIYIF